MCSRVLGLIRDHYQAVFFGTGPIATAWEIAYMFPNMLRNLLAEGVLSQSFIPIYSESLKKSKEEADRVAGIIISFLFLFLLILVSAGISIFPEVLPFYSGKSPEESALLIELSQVMFVFILTASLTAMFSGISNTHLLFSVPALSPILLNIVLIGGYLVLDPLHLDGESNARYLSRVVAVGGFLQLSFQMFYVWRKGHWPKFSLNIRDPALKKIFSLMAPAAVGASLFQLNQLLDIAIAGYFIPEEAGAVPGLRFAHRLIQLPTGIIGVALSTSILPALTALIRANRSDELGKEFVEAVSFSAFLTLPATIGLYLLGPYIIDFIFYGGAWDAKSSLATWTALQYYCLGIPLYSANKVLTSSFFAMQDTKTPVRILMVVVLINFSLNLSLVGYMQQGGLALSTAICAFINFGMLLVSFRKKISELPYLLLLKRLSRQIPLWLFVFLYLFSLLHVFNEPIESAGRFFAGIAGSKELPRYTGSAYILIGVGGVLPFYFLFAWLLNLDEWRVFRRSRK